MIPHASSAGKATKPKLAALAIVGRTSAAHPSLGQFSRPGLQCRWGDQWSVANFWQSFTTSFPCFFASPTDWVEASRSPGSTFPPFSPGGTSDGPELAETPLRLARSCKNRPKYSRRLLVHFVVFRRPTLVRHQCGEANHNCYRGVLGHSIPSYSAWVAILSARNLSQSERVNAALSAGELKSWPNTL